MLIAGSLFGGFALYFFFLGLWLLPGGKRRFSDLALAVLFGLAIHHFLVLIGGSLRLALIGGLFIAAAGVFYRRRTSVGALKDVLRNHRGRLAAAILLSFGIAMLWLGYPVKEWDARSIWFFHARILFWDGGLFRNPVWTEPELGWMHADYPHLIAVLAAQVARGVGYWNDYLPKLSLVIVELPVALVLVSLARPRWSFLFLVFAVWADLYGAMTIGYMDGFLAQYIACGMFFLVRWWQTEDERDWWLAWGFLGLQASLKNEGTLALACAIAVVGLGGLRKLARLRATAIAAAVFFVVSGAGVWLAIVKLWHLDKVDPLIGPGFLGRVKHRLGDFENVAKIYRQLGYGGRVQAQGLFFCLSLGFANYTVRQLPTKAFLGFAAWSLLYLGALFLVYLGTPFDLEWHLITSGLRTAMSPATVLAVGSFACLKTIESGGTDSETTA